MRVLVVIVHTPSKLLASFIFLLLHYECGLLVQSTIHRCTWITPAFTSFYYKYNKRSSIRWKTNEKKNIESRTKVQTVAIIAQKKCLAKCGIFLSHSLRSRDCLWVFNIATTFAALPLFHQCAFASFDARTKSNQMMITRWRDKVW